MGKTRRTPPIFDDGFKRSTTGWIVDDVHWDVHIHWDVINGRAEPVGFEVESFNRDRPITTALIRSIPIATLIDEHRRVAQRTLRAWADGSLGTNWPDAVEAAAKQLPTWEEGEHRSLTGPNGEPLPADEALRVVAEVYRDAWAVRSDPTTAVAETFSLSKSAAAKRVSRARKEGYLPPTTQGRAGVAVTGTGSATTAAGSASGTTDDEPQTEGKDD